MVGYQFLQDVNDGTQVLQYLSCGVSIVVMGTMIHMCMNRLTRFRRHYKLFFLVVNRHLYTSVGDRWDLPIDKL